MNPLALSYMALYAHIAGITLYLSGYNAGVCQALWWSELQRVKGLTFNDKAKIIAARCAPAMEGKKVA